MKSPSHRALVIDDEPVAREDLRRLLAAHAEVEVIAEAGRMSEAQAALARDDYDLVFLDVQLRGGNGFDLVPLVRPAARIIFVTAHDRYALRAFTVNALDYLLKPVEPARLAESLRRLGNVPGVTEAPPPADPGMALNRADTVLLKTTNDVARFVRLTEIAAIFSNENYTELRLTTGEKLMARRPLKTWEEQLPAADFMRVHRTAIINLHELQRAAHHDREVTHLWLQSLGEHLVRARRELWPELERRIGRLGRRLE
ncbi:MAG: LytTR family DNA-binding domain-containing protein [Verrucomicrobiota bacterium]